MLERAVCFGDVHIPFHDPKACELLFEFIYDFRPNKIFINGDLLDCWEISKFDKPLHLEKHLRDEIKDTVMFLKGLRTIAPRAEIVYIAGNHEFRLETYIARNARELYGLKGMSLEEQLELDHFKIKFINNHLKENYYRYGHLLIGHWNKANKHAGYTAKNLLDEKGMSLIQGHTHRLAMVYKRDYDGEKVAIEGGCLCDINPPYCSLPNWLRGFVVIQKDKTGFFKVTLVEIIENQVMWGDKIYKV